MPGSLENSQLPLKSGVTPLTDEEVKKIVMEEITAAVGYYQTELKKQRTEALEYFYGEDFGNELEGRSSYVSPDVRDTILWIMPSLMRIFTGGDNIVRFEPQGPEDEQAADQATDYVNYVFQRQNDGFLTLHTWFMDALLSKNGFVKVYWDKYTETKTETYEGLSDDEFVMLVNEDDIEVLAHTENKATLQTPQGPQEVVFHDVQIKQKEEKGKCCVIPVPPEEILVSKNPLAPLSRNRFVCHRRKVTLSELREMGYDNVDDLPSFDERGDFDEERIARYTFDETDTQDTTSNPANRYTWYAEAYLKLDVDGDGISELRRVCIAGDRVLENEEAEGIPFVTLTPIPLPHKLYGMSIHDLMGDLQLLKSTIFRQILDNMYLANNGRYMALDGMVNIDDLLTSRPGGIVRVKTFDAVKPMQPPLLGAPAFNLLEYVDHIKDVRTGINQDMQGLDPNTLNKTASAQANRLGAAQSRIELIARIFAETGVKDLFYSILKTVQEHQDKPEVIRLRNQWVTMDPREWNKKFDLSVSVGLGTGTKDSIVNGIGQTIQLQLMMMQGGLPIVQPKNVYNAAMELLKAQSIKSGDLFFTDPSQVPPQQQPNPAAADIAKQQIKSQADLQKQGMKDQAGLQKEMMKQGGKFQIRKMEMGMEDLQHQRETAVDMIKHHQQLHNELQNGPTGTPGSTQ